MKKMAEFSFKDKQGNIEVRYVWDRGMEEVDRFLVATVTGDECKAYGSVHSILGAYNMGEFSIISWTDCVKFSSTIKGDTMKTYTNFKNYITIKKSDLRREMFQWLLDEDGDLVLRIFGFINIVKYKESMLINFNRKPYKPAPKRLVTWIDNSHLTCFLGDVSTRLNSAISTQEEIRKAVSDVDCELDKLYDKMSNSCKAY